MQNEERIKIQNEAYDEALKHKRRTLALSMRVGKTLIGIRVAHAKYLEIVSQESRKPKILVVAPKLAIFESWKEDLDKFNYQYLHENIEYSTYVSFNKLDLSKYDLIIFDECHSLKRSHAHLDTHNLTYRDKTLQAFKGDILGLTGTAPVNGYSEKATMIKRFCPIVYNYTTEEAITENILNDYRIIVHRIPLSHEKNIHVKKGKWDFYTSEIDSYKYLTKMVDEAANNKAKQWAAITRMKQMQGFKSKEVYTKKLLEKLEDKCLIFANTKEQADLLCTHSYYSGNSSNEVNLQLFKAGVIKDLSCVEQLSEGITIPDLKTSIIMHCHSANSAKPKQKFGRALSLSVDEMSTVHVLMHAYTCEEKYVAETLADLDQSKIKYIDHKF